jgi:ABC-2 type transport system ATP-binding protein
MPEERGLYPRMTVLDQVSYFGRLHGMEQDSARRRAAALLEELGLTERVDTRVLSLSHGNQQRVQLAVALVHDPQLLILDEPFSGLDPIAAETMAGALRQRAEEGAAVLFSSHQLDVVEHLCRQVVIIDSGRVVLSGRVDDLRAASPHRHVEIVVRGSRSGWMDMFDPGLIKSRDGDRILLEVNRDADPGVFFGLGSEAGEMIEFSFSPPPLSQVFLEAVQR